ncbi:hypothetical protein BDD12DRAFT_848342 [Trichophaea hybrida]|nr:hypothetical protein BDD12DRAFT_848342 [Trichophaea hybrida]
MDIVLYATKCCVASDFFRGACRGGLNKKTCRREATTWIDGFPRPETQSLVKHPPHTHTVDVYEKLEGGRRVQLRNGSGDGRNDCLFVIIIHQVSSDRRALRVTLCQDPPPISSTAGLVRNKHLEEPISTTVSQTRFPGAFTGKPRIKKFYPILSYPIHSFVSFVTNCSRILCLIHSFSLVSFHHLLAYALYGI